MKRFINARIAAAVLLAVAAISLLAGCGGMKEPIDRDTFIAVLEGRAFEVNDWGDEVEEPMVSAVVGVSPDADYQIELVEYASAEMASGVFDWGKSSYESMASGNKTYKSMQTGVTYGSYSLKVNGMYYRILQAQNTVLAVQAPAEFSDEIEEIIEALK